MENAKLIADLLRAGLAALSAVREFRKNASEEQLTALVAAIHTGGGTVDLAAVDSALAQASDAQADLEAQIRNAGG